MKTTIVLPTYNEAANIDRLLGRLLALDLPAAELSVLVVDDRSPDGTGEIVRKLAEREQRVRLLEGKKAGLGSAYVRGMLKALADPDVEVVMQMDADFSHTPEDVPRLLGAVAAGADVAIGSRYVEGGRIDAAWSRWRLALSRWGNRFARWAAGLSDVHDCTSGFRAIRSEFLRRRDWAAFKTQGYAFQVELLTEIVLDGARVQEVPIYFPDRAAGASKLGWADLWEFARQIWRIRARRLSALVERGIRVVRGDGS